MTRFSNSGLQSVVMAGCWDGSPIAYLSTLVEELCGGLFFGFWPLLSNVPSSTYVDTHSSALRVKKFCTAGRRVLFLFSFFGFSDRMRLILHRAKKIFSAVISHVCVAYKIAEKIRLH